SVVWTESAATEARLKFPRQRNDAPLPNSVNLFTQRELRLALPERKVEQRIGRQSPLVIGRPALPGGRIVDEPRNPAQRRVVTERPLGRDARPTVTEMIAGPDEKNRRGRRPFPFLRRGRDFPRCAHREAIRIPQPGGDRFEFFAVFGNLLHAV